jgi:hypothetical protein
MSPKLGNSKWRTPRPYRDKEREMREVVVEDANETEGEDRDLVHGDGGTLGLGDGEMTARRFSAEGAKVVLVTFGQLRLAGARSSRLAFRRHRSGKAAGIDGWSASCPARRDDLRQSERRPSCTSAGGLLGLSRHPAAPSRGTSLTWSA